MVAEIAFGAFEALQSPQRAGALMKMTGVFPGEMPPFELPAPEWFILEDQVRLEEQSVQQPSWCSEDEPSSSQTSLLFRTSPLRLNTTTARVVSIKNHIPNSDPATTTMSQDHYSPSGRGPEVIAVCSFFSIFATITFALRVHVRVNMVKWFGVDDWAAAVGWFLFVLHGAFSIAGAAYGTGQHTDLIKPAENVPIALKWWWVCEVLHVLSNIAIKLSIALMLLRLVVETSHRVLIYIVTGAFQVYSIGFFFLFIFQCMKPSFFWTRFGHDTHGRCMSMDVIVITIYIYAGITLVYDLTMAILPWFIVRKLQLSFRTKVMVACVLATGSIASVATIVRIGYIAGLRDRNDLTYNAADVGVWSCAETGLSIAASCAATLKPLFKRFAANSKFFGTNSTTACSTSASLTLKPESRGRSSKSHHGRTSYHSLKNSMSDLEGSIGQGPVVAEHMNENDGNMKEGKDIVVDVRRASDYP